MLAEAKGEPLDFTKYHKLTVLLPLQAGALLDNLGSPLELCTTYSGFRQVGKRDRSNETPTSKQFTESRERRLLLRRHIRE